MTNGKLLLITVCLSLRERETERMQGEKERMSVRNWKEIDLSIITVNFPPKKRVKWLDSQSFMLIYLKRESAIQTTERFIDHQ